MVKCSGTGHRQRIYKSPKECNILWLSQHNNYRDKDKPEWLFGEDMTLMHTATQVGKAIADGMEPREQERVIDASLLKATRVALKKLAKRVEEAEKQAELEQEEEERRKNMGFKRKKKAGIADLEEGPSTQELREEEGHLHSADFANNPELKNSYALATKMEGQMVTDMHLKDPNLSLTEHYAGRSKQNQQSIAFGRNVPSEMELRLAMERKLNGDININNIFA